MKKLLVAVLLAASFMPQAYAEMTPELLYRGSHDAPRFMGGRLYLTFCVDRNSTNLGLIDKLIQLVLGATSDCIEHRSYTMGQVCNSAAARNSADFIIAARKRGGRAGSDKRLPAKYTKYVSWRCEGFNVTAEARAAGYAEGGTAE